MEMARESARLLGAHMSVAKGLHLAFERIRQVGGTALQIFTRNQRQWDAADLAPEEISQFRQAWEAWGSYPVAAHTSYLINLGGSGAVVRARSQQALVRELVRCEQLGIHMLVMHPGSHTGAGQEAGLARLAGGLDRCMRESGVTRVRILLETTAGQGTGLGATFAELRQILDRVENPDRYGVCFDTCHVFAAGHDLSTKAGYEATMEEFERTIGLSRIAFFHLNDAKTPCGSRRDRHEHIGLGHIGLSGFGLLLNDHRFENVPMVLETPKGEDLELDRQNLQRLRSLLP